MKNNYALISGASSGLGKEFAVECAKMGFNLVLLSLPGTNLPEIANRIEKELKVNVISFQLDLTDNEALRGFINEVNKLNIPLNLLINNAGIGGTGELLDTCPQYIEKIILLNVLATTMLTRHFLPTLIKQPQSFILNVSSLAAFSPIPYKTIYPATKSFIQSFSLSLRKEMQGSSVSVSVVNPGPILTNFDTAKRIIEQGKIAQLGVLTAGEVAKYALEKCLQKKAVIVPGFWNKLNYWLMKIVPDTLKSSLLAGIFKNEMKDDALKYEF